MATAYPNNLDNFINPVDNDKTTSSLVPHATQHANANDAIEAIEAELGINPSGSSVSVKVRLDAIDAAIATLGTSAFSSLPDASITSAKLANLAVTTTKLANDAVTAPKLASDSVTTSKIANNSVTAAKLSGMLVPIICTSSTRPSSPATGQYIYETDTLKTLVWNSVRWVLTANQAWVAWTPTWTGFTTGNGASNGRYMRLGNTVWGSLIFTLGSTSAVTGNVTFTLPIAPATLTGVPLGYVALTDTGTATYSGVMIMAAGGTSANLVVDNVSGTYPTQTQLTSLIPLTWTTGDVISATFMYESNSISA